MLFAKMLVCVLAGSKGGRKKGVTGTQSLTLFALTAGQAIGAVDMCPGSFLMAAGG